MNYCAIQRRKEEEDGIKECLTLRNIHGCIDYLFRILLTGTFIFVCIVGFLECYSLENKQNGFNRTIII